MGRVDHHAGGERHDAATPQRVEAAGRLHGIAHVVVHEVHREAAHALARQHVAQCKCQRGQDSDQAPPLDRKRHSLASPWKLMRSRSITRGRLRTWKWIAPMYSPRKPRTKSCTPEK